MRAALLVLAVASLAAVSAGTVGAALPANLPAAASPVAAPPPSGGASGTAMAAATQLLPSTESGLLSLAESGIEAARRNWRNPALGWYDERARRAGSRQAARAGSGPRSPSSRRSTRSRSRADAANLAAVNAFAARPSVLQPRPAAGRRLRLVHRDDEPPRAHLLRRQRLVGARASSTPTAPRDEPRDLPTPSVRSAFIAGLRLGPGRRRGTGGRRCTCTRPRSRSRRRSTRLRPVPDHRRSDLSRDRRAVPRLGRPPLLELGGSSSTTRNSDRPTVLDYVEGMMIGAQLELCQITGVQGPCTQARQLAAASVAGVPAATPLDAGRGRRSTSASCSTSTARTATALVPDRLRERQRAFASCALAGRPLLQALGRHAVPGRPAPARRRHAQPVRLACGGERSAAAASESAEGAVDDVELPISVSPKALSFPASTLDQPRNRGHHGHQHRYGSGHGHGGGARPTHSIGENATFAVANGCPSGPLLPGQRCQLDVTFTPSNLARATIALTVETTTAAGTGLPVEVSLEGTTARPDLTEVAAPLRRAAPVPARPGPRRSVPRGSSCVRRLHLHLPGVVARRPLPRPSPE